MNLAVKIFAAVGVVALVATAVLVVGAQHLAATGLDARSLPGAMEVQLARTARRAALPVEYTRLENPVRLDSELRASAMAHWADHCASCHSNNGSGTTALGLSMYPRPPDLRAAETQSESDGFLYHSIENGIRLSGMPAWGKGGTADTETWALVAFIRYLPSLTVEEGAAMKAMNPVSAADVKAAKAEDAFLNGENEGPPQSL